MVCKRAEGIGEASGRWNVLEGREAAEAGGTEGREVKVGTAISS